MEIKVSKYLASLVLAGFAATTAQGANLVWVGGSSVWNNAANWSPAQIPGAADTAIITNAGTYTVTIDQFNPTVAGLLLGGGAGLQTILLDRATLTLSGSSTINTNGRLQMVASTSTLAGNGSLTVNGSFLWARGDVTGAGALNIGATGVLTINGNVSLTGRTLNNSGLISWTAGSFSLAAGSVVNNLSTGIFDDVTDGNMTSAGNPAPVFNNAGLFKKSAGATRSDILPLFNNSGTVDGQAVVLSFGGSGTHSGTFITRAGTTVDFAGGAQVLTASSLVRGGGTMSLSGNTASLTSSGTFDTAGSILTVSAGTATLASGCVVSGSTLNLQGNNGLINFNTASSVAVVNANAGTLGGTSPVTITGMLTMGGGRLTNPYVAANGGINFNGGGTLDGGKLVNSGTAIWSLGNITGANGAFFSNLAGATFNNTFDGNLPSGAGATPTFVNNGLFQKTGGSAVPGPTTTDFQFINTGTVEVRTNSLRYALNQQTAGITLLNGGGLDSQAVPIQFAGGTLMGTGLVTVANLQTVTNAATFSPGLPIGQLDITGNYFQTPAGALNIEIGGYQPGIEHDLVTVTSGGAGGSAALSGRLNISFVNGFVPTNGATFTILTALSRFGSFSSFNYPSNDIGLQLSYDATSAKVIVSNLKPVVAHPIANPAAITYGSAVNLQFAADTFSDPDNNALTYTALGLPSGASFSSATRTVSGTPTQAGAFTVQIVAADDGIPSLSVTNSFTLTVNPAPLTVTASAQSKTYGADLALGTTAFSTIGLQNGDTVTGVTLAASGNPAGSAALAPVGAYTITPSAATGSSFVASNYTITYTSGVLTVNPKAATVVANSKAKAYGDSNPVLDAVVTGTANGDVLAYTLATTATVNSGVGSYPITVTLGSNPNYSITPTGSTLAVSARPATVQANAKSKIYGAANPTLDAVVTGTANGDVLAYSLATTATVTSGVATYPITVTLGSNPNYSVAPSNSLLSVTAKAATVVANSKSKTYGDVNPALDAVVTGTVNGDTLSYTLATTATATSGIGSYPISVTLGSNPNYTVTPTDSSLTVATKSASVVANVKTKTYGAANPVLDAVVAGTVNGDILAYSLATTATVTSGVGSYPITVTLGSNPNYSLLFTNSLLNVTAKTATVIANAKSKTYGDVNPVLDAVVTGTVNGDTLAYTLATTATATSGIGSYPISVTLGSNPNYTVTPTDSSLTVATKSASVVANVKTKTYGAANPVLDAVVTGTVNGDILAYSLATTATVTSGVGSYPITVTLGSNPNYSLLFTNSLLNVTAKTATVIANAKSKTYGDVNPALDAVVTGTVNGDTLAYSLATTATGTSGIGSYPIAVTLGSNPNYSVTPTDSSLTVGAKPASVVANSKSKTYGSANPVLDAVVTGTVNGDILAYSLATTATVTSGVGSYPITVTLGSNPNYSLLFTNSLLSVTAKSATVVANSKSKTYGDANPALDAVVTGTVNGDSLTYSLATTATVTSGTGSYPIAVTLGSNPNYSVTPTDSSLTVSSKVASVLANAKTRTYGAANPAFDAVVTGTVNGDILAYSLSTIATVSSGVGAYPITVTLGSNPNYSLVSSNSLLTVTVKSASVVANAKSKTYGGVNPLLDAAVTGTVNGDVLSYTLATTSTTTSGVGSYPITVTLGSNPNYTVTPTDSTLTVSSKAASLVANAKFKTYGAANPLLDAVVTGTVNGDILAYSLATTATVASGVGSYPITITLGSNPNYSVTPTDSSLAVSAKSATVIANSKSKTYGEVNPLLDAVVSGTVNGDILSYSLATTATATSGVGSYPISVTLGSNPNYSVTPTDSSLTVGSKSATVVANSKSKTYGDVNPVLDAVVTGTVNGDTLSYTLATTATGTSGVGSYPISVTLGSNPNYSVTPTDSSLTVGAKAASVLANAKSKTYGSANPVLDAVVTGTVNGDILAFSLATTATTTSGVGTYPITVSLGTNANYSLVSSNSLLSVTAKTATVVANSKSKTYGDVNPVLDAVVTGTVNGDTLSYTLATTATGTSGVGSYPISVTLGSNPNYSVTPTDSSLTVGAKAASVLANAKSKTYGSANPVLDAVVTGTVNGDILAFSLATTATSTSGVGTYPITVSLGTNANYSVVSSNSLLSVTAKSATVVANSKSKTYGDVNPVLDAVVTGTVNGDTLSYTLATTATATSGVGSYPISVTLGSNPNYSVTPTDSSLTVGAKAASVLANAKSKTYGSANPVLDAVVTGTVNGDILAFSLATTATTTSGVGTYPITVSLGTNANYSLVSSNSLLSVTAKTATVAANSKSKTYGDVNPVLDAVVTGTVNGDTLAYTLATTATGTSGVGSYPITVTLGSNPNYSVTPTDSSLTVSAKAASVLANAKSKTYGSANPVLDAAVTGTVNGDILAFSLATTATTTSGVGTYPITVSLGTNANYSVVSSNSLLSVTAKTATVVANSKSKTYGDVNPVLDAVVTGTVNGDTLSYTLATTATGTSGVGSYPISVTLGSNPNYNVTPTDSSLTVGAKAASVLANAKSKTYGSANPVLDAAVTGTVNGDILAYSLATTATTTSSVGSYPITVSLGTNANYSLVSSNSLLSVTAKTATVVANSKSKTYGDVNPVLDAVVTGTVNGDTLAYTLATTATATSGVGSYPISVTLGSNPNYSVTPTDSSLTVGAKAASVLANAKSKTYGSANPVLDAVVTGTVNGDILAFSLATTATTTSGVGTYPITVSLGTNANYSVVSSNSLLSVTAKSATVVANSKSKTYGDVNPLLDAVVTGTVNGDTLAYTLATTATATSGVGSYPISVTLGSNPNYSVNPTDSSLTVGAKAASVLANAKTKTYGSANPVLDAVVTGTVNGDILAFSLATTATTTSGVGTYPITVSLGTNANYSLVSSNNLLSVTAKTATVVANSKSKTYGDVNPVLDAVVTGTVNGDTLSYTLATTATTTSGVGSYPISVTLGSNPNYSVTPTDSSLTVSAKAASVLANAKSKTYGSANPVLDAAVTGTVNGDILAFSLATTATTTSGVGTYPITVSLGTNANYSVVSSNNLLSVTAKTATVVANSKSKTYGDVNPVLDAVVTGTVNGDTLAYTLATTATATSGVGSYPITVTLGSNPNYSVTPTDSSLTVGAKAASVLANAKSKTYGSANPVLDAAVTGTVNGDILAFSLATTATTTSGVGAYPITVSLGTNANYSVVSSNSLLSVTAKSATVVANSKSKTYGDVNPVLDAVVTGTVNGDTLAYTLATTATATSGVGSYPISVTLGSNPNYSVTPTDSSLTVGAKAASVLANAKSKTYGSANPVLDAVVTGTVNGDILAFSLATTATTTSGVGAYPITVSLGTNANYSLVSSNSLLSVTAKTATVVANSKSKTYGDVNPVLDAVVTGTVNGDTLAYTLATTATGTSGVGSYPISVTLGSNPNYSVTPTDSSLTVSAKAASVLANAKSKTYGSANPVLDAAVTGTVNGDILAFSLATTATTTSGVGTYPITVSLGTNANYSVVSSNSLLSVTAKSATVVANSKSKTYGDVNPVLDAVVTGTVNGDTLAYTLATTATSASGVGSYPISVTLGSNPNYSVTPTDSSLTVSAKAAIVLANAKSKTYGSANPVLDAVVTGTVNGDILAFSLATTATTTSGVGTYPITVSLGTNANYSLVSSNSLLSVTAKTATVVANSKSKTYGDVNPLLDAVVTGTVNGDTLAYTLATTATATSGVGSYPITVTLGSNPNYSVTPTDSSLTVGAKAASVLANAKSKIYGSANPVLDAVVTGTVNGDILAFSLATTATVTSGVGTYPITVSLGTNANYSLVSSNSLLSVTAKTATVVANSKSKTYGDVNPVLDAVVTGTVNGDTLAYTLATTATATSGVGSYPITVTLGSNPNYSVTPTDSSLTVGAKAASVLANAKSKIYGSANPVLDAVVTGTVNGDILAFSLATTATVTSGVGTYPITVSLGTNANYSLVSSNSLLSVTAKTATVVANSKSKTYGDVNPVLDAVVTGTVNGDTLAYTLATTATATSGVGSYPITVTLGSNPNYSVTPTDSSLTVGAKAASVLANAKSKTYGSANPVLDAVVTGTVNGDILAFSLATTATTTSGVGTYPITVSLGTNANYSLVSSNSLLSVTAKTATVVANSKSKTYGDVNPVLDAVVTGTVNGDTLAYTLATTATGTSGVGSYPITVTLGSNPNYSVTPTDSSLTVSAKAASVLANAKSKTYGSANPVLDAVVTGTVNGDILAFSLATTATTTSGVGTYPITVSLGTNANYSLVSSNSLLSVTAKTATVVANSKSKTYGDVNPLLDAAVTGTVNGDTLSYTLATTATGTSGVGSYPISVTLGSNPNYSVTPTDSSLTVSAKAASVLANSKSKTYGDVNPVLDAVVTGTVNGDTLAYTLATTATATSGVGSYPITVTLGSNPNYSVTPTDSSLTVGAKAASVLANAKSKTYGSANPVLDAAVTGTVNGDILAFSLATTATTISGVGTYPITVSLGTNANYSLVSSNSLLSVTAKTATVAANSKSKTYGDVNPVLDAVVTGTVNGDTLSYTLATTATGTSGVGSYPITVTLGSNPNYSVTPTDSSLTVGAKAASVLANAKSKTYGSANPVLDAVVTGTVNGDILAFSLATTATTTSGVGSYPITVSLGTNANYSLVSSNSLLSVTAKTATVVANSKSKTYGSANPVLDAAVTGTVNGDTLSYTLATTATGTSGVGSYPISVTLGSNPNYNVTPTDSSLTVSAKAASVLANAKSKTYGSANPALDAAVTGTVNGDILAFSLATTATTTSGVGTYPITVSLGTNANYSLVSSNSLLSVTAKTATVVANSKSKTYGDVNPVLDAVVTGTVNGDTLSYTLATTATGTSGVGSYPISVTLGSNPNYSVTPTDSSLTVGAKAASVLANAKSKTYGSANPALDAVVSGTVNGDILAYSLATTATTTSGVGTYPITVSLGTNANYSLVSSNSLLSVTAKTATVVANSKSKTYGSANPVLDAVVTGTVNGDILAYSLATTATTTSGVGTYPITVSLGTNANYSVVSSNSLLSVTAKTATVVANSKSKTYGDVNPVLDAVVTGTVNGDTLAYTLATTATGTSGVGSYPISVTLGSNPNYSVTPTDSSLTVSAKAASVLANAKSKTYGSANPALDAVVTGTVNGDILAFSLATTATTTSGVGTYPITVSLGTNANYSVVSSNSLLSVTAKTATVVANSKSKTYGDVNPVLDAVVTGTVNGDTLAYTLATTATATSGVGSYPITVTLGSNPNYSVTPTDSSLTVGAKAASVLANAKSKTYGSANPVLDAVVTGTVNGDILAFSLATTATTTSGVGSYPITVSLGTNANYSVVSSNSLLSVTAKTATVVANSKSKTYGSANPVLDAVVTGTVNGDILAYSLATTATTTSGVGSYPITVSLGTNANYSVVSSNSLLSVTAKTATVVANSKSKTYGDVNPVLDAVVTGTVNGDTLAYTLATTATTTSGVGSYPITVTVGSNPNYTVTPTDSSLTVGAKAASVLANAKSKTYGSANPVLDAAVTGTVNGDILAYSLATTATTASGVGSYPITVSLGTNANYSLVSSNSLLSVTAKTATVVANSKSKTYGDVNPVLDAVVTGTVNGDTLGYTLATTATTNSGVGAYPVTVTLGSNPNYVVARTNGLLTVIAKPLVVTANNQTKVVGAADPVFGATYAGFVNGETSSVLTGTLVFNRAPGETAGSYAITPSGLSSVNYAITFVAGTLSITPGVSTPVVLSITRSGASGISIRWPSIANKTYRVQTSSGLNSSTWTDLPGDVVATGTTAEKIDSILSGLRFYRVQVLP